MPDFDKNLQSIIKDSSIPFEPTSVRAPRSAAPISEGVSDFSSPNLAKNDKDVFDILDKLSNSSNFEEKGVFVTNETLQSNRRYDTFNPIIADQEDFAAYNQGTVEKAFNGTLKGANLVATTVAGGFGMLLGAAKWAMPGGKFSDIWDNPVMQGLDKWNNKVDQEYLPNYYTNKETQADWYDRDNWMTSNFLFDKIIKNSGFAVGAMVSGNIANGVLGAAGAAIGRGALAGALAAESSQAFKLFTPLLRSTSRAFSAAKNIEAAAILEKEISSIADVVTRSSKLAQLAKSTNAFAGFNDAARRTAIAAYSSAGEASFEALQTSNEFRKTLIQKYINETGTEPTGADLQNINDTAAQVGATSFIGNLALLSVTEFNQLPNLLGSSYKTTKNAANSLMGQVDNVLLKDGKYISDVVAPTTRFGKLYNSGKRIAGYVLDPKEGAQEIGQYALQVGTQNYFEKGKQGNDAKDVLDSIFDSAKYAFFDEKKGALMSKEGIEGGIIGALTGGVMQSFGKQGAIAQEKQLKSNTERFVSGLNNAPTFKQAFVQRMQSINRGVALQQQYQDAVIQGDKLEAMDTKADMMHNYLTSRINYGRFDMVMDDIAELKQMGITEEGLATLKEQGIGNINDTVESFQKRLTQFETIANNTNEIIKSTNLRFAGETVTDSEGNVTRKYSPSVIDKLVYAASKIADYDLRIPEVAMLPLSKGVLVQDIVNEELTNDESTALNDKLAELDLSPEVDTVEVKQGLIDSVELSKRRRQFLNEYNDIVNQPDNYIEEDTTSIEDFEGAPKETITIKTKSGDRNIEIGTEYFLGKVTEYSEKGNEVYRAPRLTVIGQNEDGTIKVKDSDGKIHDLKPSTLQKYNLGKVSSTLSNRKAKFYMEHWNTFFEFNFGKGIKKTGRLEYEQVENGDDKLYFVYKNKKGEIKRIEVTGNQFVANKKKGFKDPMIKEVGELTATQKKAKQDYISQKDKRTEAKLERRAEILGELYEEVLDKQESTQKLVVEKTKKLESIKSDIASTIEQIETNKNVEDKRFKTFKFKQTIGDAISHVTALSRMEQDLQQELEELETVQEELQLSVDYISDLIDNIESLPEATKDFIEELNDELIDLNILVEETGKQINMISALIKATTDAIKSAIKYISSLIKSFESRYPNVPTTIGQQWVDFLSANPNFLNIKPNYKAELDALDTTIALTEEGDIKPNETRLEDLNEHLDVLQAALKDYENQIKVREDVLSKLEDIYNRYLEQKAQEQELARNEQLLQEFIGTLDQSSQIISSNTNDEKVYEPDAKKSDYDVVGGTRPVTNDRPHNIRANNFGNRYTSFDQKKKQNIKGLIVTSKTQNNILPGMAELIVDNEANPNDVIALVMVATQEDGTYKLVDEFGNTFTDEQLKKPLDHAIFQVFPGDNLQGNYSGKTESMFRNATAEDRKPIVEELTKQYRDWRKEELAKDELSYPEDFKTSFGIPQYVTNLVEKVVGSRTVQVEEIDYDAKTPVEKTGIVSSKDLSSKKVLVVSTGDTISEGSSTFNTPPGRVFLFPGNGLIKLNNRKLTSKETNSIYEAIYQLSKIAFTKGSIKDDAEADQIVRWLKSVVYWGIARSGQTGQRKAAGYNNIWFEKITENGESVTKLFVSGLGGSINFTPSEISARKNELLTLFSALYHNVNATNLNDDSWSKPYYEIIGFEKDGVAITRQWDNYQTYLLSSEGRKADEIPLTTIVKPKQGDNDFVRKGIYFTLNNSVDRFNAEVATPAPKSVTEEPTVAQQAQVAGAVDDVVASKPSDVVVVDKTTPASTFVLDGKTVHSFVTPRGALTITIDKEGVIDAVTNTEGEVDDETFNTIKKFKEELYPDLEGNELYSKVLALLETVTKRAAIAQSIPQDNAVTATPVIEASVATEPVVVSAEEEEVEVSDEENIGKEITAVAPFNAGSTTGKIVSIKENKTKKGLYSIVLDNGEKVSGSFENNKFTWVQNAKPAAEETPVSNNPFANRKSTNGLDGLGKEALREFTIDKFRQFTPENFDKLEDWFKSKFAGIPVYRVKNVITASNGRQAWGMFHKGAIYLYENAEIGTAYHEVFEAVWAMMTSPAERKTIAKDFRNREGSYVDRFTGETVEYKNATDDQMREELAEEFRDFVLYDKNPKQAAVPKTPSFLRKIFNEIVDFIKSFFIGKDAIKNTQDLFDRIGNGYYRTYNPYEQKLSFANVGYVDINEVIPDGEASYRLQNLSATDVHQVMQQMTYKLLTDQLFKSNESLFEITSPKSKTELYNSLKEDLLERIGRLADQIQIDKENGKLKANEADSYYNNLGVLYNNINNQWSDIVKKHGEYLASYNLVFDENDEINYDDYEKGKDDGYGDARQIDGFRKTNAAIKLLLATIPEVTVVGNSEEVKLNNIAGATLLPLGSVYVDLMNKLHDSVDQTDMINKFRQAAINNPNYRSLFYRVFKVKATSNLPVDYNSLEKHDLRLINAFWKTFKKQSPNVSALFILSNGEVVVGDSNTSGATRENRRQFTNAIIETIKSGKNPYIIKNSKGVFVPTDKLVALSKKTEIKDFVSVLSNLGIEFSEKELMKLDYTTSSLFKKAVNGIIDSLKQRVTSEGLAKINADTLDIAGRLLELGLIKSKISSSEFETTYFNINGERSQTFLGPNLLSNFYDVISKVTSLSDLEKSNFSYILTDSFTKGSSVMVDRIFNESGEKKEIDSDILKPYIIDGTINEELGKNTDSSRLNKRQRYTQEMNMNAQGIYMNLVPGDANMQTAIKLHSSDNPFVTEDMYINKGHLNIFKNYFLSEAQVSREINRNVAKGRNKTDLRFFKPILGEALHKKIVNRLQKSNDSVEEVYEEFNKEITNKVQEYIDAKTSKSLNKLGDYKIISSAENGYSVEGLSIFNSGENYSMAAIENKIKINQINFMIANIELHKLIYSDPYLYSDELKRIKNFTSPRQILSYGNSAINSRLNELYNNPNDDLFNTDFNRDTINGATISDVLSDNEELGYDPFEETDGGGYITDKGLRFFKIKNSEWTDANEEQYVYDMAYMKNVLNKPLSAIEKEALKKGNPNEQSNYTPIKPIVAGNKNMGRSYNDVLLDKFALFPISFRMIHQLNPTANMLKLYEKMIADDVDYAVYQTGRKVGVEKVYQLYNKDGSFNTAPLISEEEKQYPTGPQTVLTIPLSIVGVQTEVPTKEENKVTQGSQPTKLATMDFMEAGVPVDFMSEEKNFGKRFNEWNKLIDKGSYNNGDNLYNELKNNQNILEARIQEGLESLFRRLGIKRQGADSYRISNPDLTIEILKQELLKREVNENTIEALEGFEQGKFVLEAIPSYQQIRNILYSIASKSVVSPKIKGGQKVQVSSALLESVRAQAKEVIDSKGNTKLVYKSDILNFYTNEEGKRVAEVMISRWFKSPLSDEELIDYFNNTEEGKAQFASIMGVAFRIPTQKQNSIEVFKVAKFLPEGFGDSVIVPSALVKKVGSDFDIDKLFMYLKNLYLTNDKSLKTVPYFGVGQEAKDKITKMYNDGEFNEYLKSIKDGLPQGGAEDRLMESIFPEEYSTQREDVINDLYRKSLDNAYIESFEKLVSHPLNFVNLVKPNSAEQMKDLTKDIEKLLGNEKIDYSNVGEMLDREFMSELRNDLVRGKYAIGIAATSQTGNAQSQRTPLTIDSTRLALVSDQDREWLGDAKIKFNNYNTLGGEPTLSKITDDNPLPEDVNYISDVIGQVIDGYVDVNKDPWIMRLGITPNVAGTWLFLIRTGVPLKDVAYFMNQPIIRNYLQLLENNGKAFLFNTQYVEAIKFDYLVGSESSESINIDVIPNVADLSKMIGKDELSLNEYQMNQQLFILDEFLKYSKMAEQLLTFTQATNFDTATFNDPFLVFKKQMQIEKARKTIFSNVDDFLDASFIGELQKAINSFRDGISEILLSDKKVNPNGESIRSVLETVLTPYTGMSDKDFISFSKKAVMTLFDWAVQTDRKMNNQITKVLLSNDKSESTASKIMKLKKEVAKDPNHKLHNNYVLKSIELESGQPDTNEVDNLYISAKDNKIYDQNQIIYGLREIKKFLPEAQSNLYGDLVRLAVLQSGLMNSRIAFTNLLPFEDFTAVYNDTLSKIDKMPNLSNFVDMNVLERSNWNDSNMVPQHKEKVILTKKGRWFKPETTMVSKKLQKAMNNGEIPKVINILASSFEGRSDVITYIWSDMQLSKTKKAEMVKRGDYSFMKKGLFKKVYTTGEDGKATPLTYDTPPSKDGRVYTNFVYKMINAWGDSLYANEFYDKLNPLDPTSTISRPSVLDNGYEKVVEGTSRVEVALGLGKTTKTSGEVEDSKIVEILEGGVSKTKENIVSLESIKPEGTIYEKSERIITRAEVRSNPKTLYLFGDNDQRKGLGGQAKEMRGEPNTVGVSTKKYPSNNESSFKTDNELENNKKIITEDINKVIAEWNTGKYNKVSVPQIGVGLAALPTRAPKTYAFLQQELNRLEQIISKSKDEEPKQINQYKTIDDQNVKDRLVNNDYYFEIGETNEPIKINKGNLERYLKNANNSEWSLLTKGMNGEFYEAEMPEPEYNIFLENNSMQYVSIQDMVDDVTVGNANYELSPEEKEAVINYLKQYGIDVSSLSKPDSVTQEEWDGLSQEEKNKINEC